MGSQDVISSEIETQVGQLLTDMCQNTFKLSKRALTYLEVGLLFPAQQQSFAN
jgi:hypothetical protein